MQAQEQVNDEDEQLDKRAKLAVLGNDFCIQVEVKCLGDQKWMWYIMVYMSTERQERIVQWNFLRTAHQQWGDVVVIAWDWNDLCSNEEKRGGRQRLASSFSGFNVFIHHMGMQKIPQSGSFFTWGNNSAEEGYTEERLDKIFVSLGWQQQFPGTKASNFFRSSSDHNVLFLETNGQTLTRKRRFQFNSGCSPKKGYVRLWKLGGMFNEKEHLCSRRKKNAIQRLLRDVGVLYETEDEIENHITDYYASLFTSEGTQEGDNMLEQIPQSITVAMNNALVA
ncbi:retrotransposon protein [Striga asiatica]|uniref:Retrotransposon protein n=1 Tax=Striga asiatica TaxID=4170 RepID=A0A5A7PVM8_STRAF|nr:retrotransposon protein [Striga asiatica]